MSSTEKQVTKPQETALIKEIFENLEAKNNLVGLFDVLFRIDKRINPLDYQTKTTQ